MHACIAFHDFFARRCDRDRRWHRHSHGGAQSPWRRRWPTGWSSRGGSPATSPIPSMCPASPIAAVLGLIRVRDLVIYDATYTDEEFDRLPWLGPLHLAGGHPPVRGGGRRGSLVAFHHDPDHDDDALDVIAAAMETPPRRLAGRPGRSGDHALIPDPARWRRLRLGMRTLLGRQARWLLHPLSPRRPGGGWRLSRRSSRCLPRALPGMLRWLERIEIIRRPSARAGRAAAGAALGPGLVPAPRRRRALRDRPKRPAAADARGRLGPLHQVPGAGGRRRRT